MRLGNLFKKGRTRLADDFGRDADHTINLEKFNLTPAQIAAINGKSILLKDRHGGNFSALFKTSPYHTGKIEVYLNPELSPAVNSITKVFKCMGVHAKAVDSPTTIKSAQARTLVENLAGRMVHFEQPQPAVGEPPAYGHKDHTGNIVGITADIPRLEFRLRDDIRVQRDNITTAKLEKIAAKQEEKIAKHQEKHGFIDANGVKHKGEKKLKKTIKREQKLLEEASEWKGDTGEFVSKTLDKHIDADDKVQKVRDDITVIDAKLRTVPFQGRRHRYYEHKKEKKLDKLMIVDAIAGEREIEHNNADIVNGHAENSVNHWRDRIAANQMELNNLRRNVEAAKKHQEDAKTHKEQAKEELKIAKQSYKDESKARGGRWY